MKETGGDGAGGGGGGEIEYIRGVAARKVKRLSADDKTASRRPAAS